MPHLHLPADHSEADLALAADLAVRLGSEDLYVGWTHEEGAGVSPEVQAYARDQRPAHPLADALVAVLSGALALWHAFSRDASARRPIPAPASAAAERTTGEAAA